MSSRANYGIDSPAIVAGFLCVGGIALVAAFVWHLVGDPPLFAEIAFVVAGVYLLSAACAMVWYSKVGKLRIRDQILESIPWRGDEMVLDVGCGRGLLLVGAARRLTTGKAIGVDRWVAGALTGNRPEAALENARLEGVQDRVELKEGDVRQLPFADGSIDVVVSNFVVHEVDTPVEREQMLREIVRALKPGGRLALVDFIFTGECVRVLHSIGIADARRERAGSLFTYWLTAALNFGLVRTYQVTGSKPLAGAARNAE
ncbi:MAG TPA: class I SAM-dependent methyltransferase [Gemmataceae bacterium]|nr:class I SAM-dependent methyltransferase [Gemmataceae bacterium]